MRSFFFHNPLFLQWLFPKRIWRVSVTEKIIYLTFDDGPHPDITPWVLQQLQEYNAKATFFLIGDNVQKFPKVKDQILALGHRIGNHTYNHWRSTKYSSEAFLENIAKANKVIESNLFRPPYGILWPAKARKIMDKGYKVVMWDIITGDFSENISPDVCASKTIKHARPGSVIVFHDSKKAELNLKKALPIVLKTLSEKGYRFEVLPQ